MIASVAAATIAARRRNAANNAQGVQSRDYSVFDETRIRGRGDQAEAGIELLKSMFSDYDDEVLFMLLQQNSYDVDATVDVILSMTDATPPAEGHTEEENNEEAQAESTDESTGIECDTTNSGGVPADGAGPADLDEDAALAAAIAAASMDEQLAAAGPGALLTDEELAFMLQNDALFQQELRAYFGEDFQLAHAPQQEPPAAGMESANESSAGTAAAAAAASASATGAAVVRGLSSMGEELRKQLGGFAAKYLQQQGSGGPGARSGGQWRARGEDVDDEEEGLELLLPAAGRDDGHDGSARGRGGSRQGSDGVEEEEGGDNDDDDEMETINFMVR